MDTRHASFATHGPVVNSMEVQPYERGSNMKLNQAQTGGKERFEIDSEGIEKGEEDIRMNSGLGATMHLN
jgi:hypothetical protein